MNFAEIDFSEYKKIRLALLRSVEDFKEESYKDTNNYATIGIGINIATDETDKIWLKIVLYYLFNLLKDENDIDFAQFDSYKFTFKNIIKDTTSYKYKQYKTLIDKIAKNTKSLKTADLNQSIETEIKAYIKETTKDNRATRLTESDLKVTKDTNNKPKYIKFKLTETQAQELLNIMIINYEATTLRLLNKKGITDFGILQAIQDKQAQRKYHKEFIPFVSATYQDGGFIKQNKLLSQANKFQSRFLMWAIIRYDFILDRDKKNDKWKIYALRMIKQSAIFNFNNKKDKEIESDEEKFNTCISIFKTLNLLNETSKTNKKQTYLKYFEGIDKKIEDTINREKTSCYDGDTPKKGGNCALYHSSYTNPNELKSLREILNPYAEYLNNLISQCVKNDNKDKGFTLENIYFIDNTNHSEVREALQFRASQSNANPNDSTAPQQNILIIITEKLNEQIRLTKPKDCYLYVVCAKGNELDCCFCNDICLDSIPQYDECELFILEGLESNKSNITPLHSNNAIELISDSKKQFSGKQDTFKYNIDKHNCLCITQNDEVIIRLANYRFFITQDNNEKYG